MQTAGSLDDVQLLGFYMHRIGQRETFAGKGAVTKADLLRQRKQHFLAKPLIVHIAVARVVLPAVQLPSMAMMIYFPVFSKSSICLFRLDKIFFMGYS